MGARDRDRYKGGSTQLRDVLLKHATQRNFIVYSEEEKTGNAKTDPKTAIKNTALLKNLIDIQPDISFVKKDVMKAMKAVSEEKPEVLKLKDQHKEAWVTAMTRRLRNLCRVVERASTEERKQMGRRNIWRQGSRV